MQLTIDQMIMQHNIPLNILRKFKGIHYNDDKSQHYKNIIPSVYKNKHLYKFKRNSIDSNNLIKIKNFTINNIPIDCITIKKNKILIRVKIMNKKKKYNNYSLHNYLKNNLSQNDFNYNYKIVKIESIKYKIDQF